MPDLLFGAGSIAAALGMTRRQVYHSITAGHLPSFKIGGTVCSRRSTLRSWLDRQEKGFERH